MPSRTPTSKIVIKTLRKQTRGKAVGKTKSGVGRAKTISLDGHRVDLRAGKPIQGFRLKYDKAKIAAARSKRKQERTRALHLKYNKAKRTETALTIPAHLMKHAVDTFGSEKIARIWLSTECGVLNNQTPAAFLQSTRNSAEVERILGCIDYGMIA